MQFDTTVNLPTLVTFGLAIIAAIVWLIRLEGRVTANDKASADLSRDFADAVRTRGTEADNFDKKLGAIQALIALHKEQFHAYQLEVAREYTTHTVVADLKRDIITEIGRMEQRVETQISRLVGETRP